MKHQNSKTILFIVLIALSMIPIRSQITDFTVFPEDAETAGTHSILATMASDELILAAVQFGDSSSSNAAGDMRDNLTFSRVANCIAAPKYLKPTEGTKTTTTAEYQFSFVDKTADADFKTKTSHLQYLKYLAKGTGSKYTGFICNFDVTGALLNGANVYKVYLYTAQKGSDSKLSFCKIPAADDPATTDVTETDANTCEYWTNYTEDVTEFATTSNGVDLNEIYIKRNTGDNTKIDVKVNNGTWQTGKTTVGGKVYFRLEKGSATEIYLGPSVHTVTLDGANNSDNAKKYMVQPGTCNNDQNRCVLGKYCTGVSDTCSGTCDPSCFKCTGANNNNCTQCHPYFNKGYSGPSTGKCGGMEFLPINKLSSDQTITLSSSNLYSHAATLSFWALVEDNTVFNKKETFNVAYQNRVKIWVGSKTDKKVGVWCIPRPNFYQNIVDGTTYDLQNITTQQQLETQKADGEKTVLFKEMDEKKDGYWFHVKCAYSVTKPHAYLTVHQKDRTILKDAKTMKTHNYIKGTEVDFPFRDFSSNNKIIISNGGLTAKGLFIKGITAFIDYIPDASQYEYYRLSKVANPVLSSLVFFAEIHDSALSGNNLTIDYLDCNPNSNSCSNKTHTASLSDTVFTIIPKYIRLNLLNTPSTFYNSKDLTTTGTLTCTANAWCFKNSELFACPSTAKYLKTDKTCAATCPSPTNAHYLPNLNSVYTGTCTSKCDTSRTCTGSDALDNYSLFTCKTNFTKSFFFCFADTDNDNGAMHYGSMFSPPTITIPVSPALNNYHIEMWYFPDPRYVAKSSSTGWNFFETNNFVCKKNVITTTTVNDYACYNGGTKIGGDVTMKYFNWHRLAFSVSGSGSSYTFSFHFNKYNASTASQSVSASLTLNKIEFCVTGCTGGNKKWASGFYKWLKVYDAQFMPNTDFQNKDVVFDYGNIYKIPRFKNVVLFYPMTLKYLAGKLKEYKTDTSTSDDITVSTGLTGDNFRSINFSKNFFTETDNKFSTSFAVADAKLGNIDTPTLANCGDSNCKHCSDVECYTCKTTHYLTKGVCKDTDSKLYLLSPGFNAGTTTPSDITFADVALTTNFSLSFFMKFFGRTSDASNDVDVMRIGTNLKLKLKFDSSAGTANLILYSDKTSSCDIANYGDFKSKFGIWTHIALSFYYDSAKLSYYPANLNFQVDFTPVKTTYSCFNKDHDGLRPNLGIVIPKESIALYAAVLLWDKYFTGVWGYQSFAGNSINPKDSKLVSSCVTQSGKSIYCYRDYTSYLKTADYCTTDARFYTGSTCLTKQTKCPYGFFENNATSDYCSCENKEKKTWIVNKTDTRHHCQKHDYIDILRHMPITVNTISEAVSEYTLEFWIYMDTYVPANFHGMYIEWNKHLRIELGYTGGSYTSTCTPVFIEGDNTAINSNSNAINFNPTQTNWGYIRCSVDITNKLYFHHDEDIITTERTLLGTHVNVAAGATTLKFKGKTDDSILSNSGVAFIRQFRLWKCYLCQDMDTHRFDMTTTSGLLYANLLHIFEAPYDDTAKITDVRPGTPVNTNLTENSNWIGYNALNASTYKRLDKVTSNNGNGRLCSEWRDVCSGLIKLNQINNVTWNDIPAPMYSRYAVDLWFMNTSTQNLVSGVHFIWRNLASVSFARDNTTASTLKSYCWPQDFRLNLQGITGNTGYQTINGLKDTTSVVTGNYDSLTNTNSNNVWVWVRCSVNWTNRFFYMSGNNQKTLEAETVYGSVKNDAPSRYLFQNNEKTKFYIWNANQNTSTDIYVRAINLYSEYIPPNYSVTNADISRIDQSKFPHLAANFSFGLYFKNLNKMLHYIGTTWGATNFTKYNGNTLTYVWYSSLTTHTQCNVARGSKGLKFDNGGTQCQPITSCDTATKKIQYCKDEDKGIVCANNYMWDTLTSHTTGACTDTCTSDSNQNLLYVRAPGSSIVSSFCNTKCDPNYQKCHNLTSAEVLNLFTNYQCKSDYDRVAYNCITKTQSAKTYMYFNGCLNFPNIVMTFPSGSGSILSRGYTLEFWFKIDRKNEFCTIQSPNKKYYFIGDPHIIYYEADSTTTTTTDAGNLTYSLYYQLVSWISTNPPTKIKLVGVSQFNWNHISIHADLVNRNLQLVVNFNNYVPAVKFTNVPASVDLTFKKLMFCSNNCTTSNDPIKNINWGAAWYKSIQVADGINFNQWAAKDYYSGIFTAGINTQHFDYPFTTAKSLYNSIANDRGMKKPFDFYAYYNTGTLNNFEKTYYFNYGSTFDYTATNPGTFIATQSLTTTSFTTGGCRAYCKRCSSNEKNSCTECLSGSKLFAGNCYRNTGKYLRMPLKNYTDKYLTLNIEDMKTNFYFDKKELYTITLWIKYEGQLLTNTDPCVVLFRFTKDGQRYICYNAQMLRLYFYDYGQIMYEDATFTYNIGQWTLLSLASFMNNVPTIKGLDKYFQYRYNFFVNDQQLIKKPEVNIREPGWKFDTIEVGYGFAGIITDLRIYRNFITNPWGYMTGPKNGIAIEFRIPMDGKKNGKCLDDNEIVTDNYQSLRTSANTYDTFDTILGVDCVDDFSPYADGASCSTDKYLDPTRFGESMSPCSWCENTCNFNCAKYETNGLGCTCDWESADHALRIDKDTTRTKCELLPYTDFAKLEEFSVGDLKAAKSGEYTIEFWYYLYTYTNTTSPFESEEIIWDDHLKIELFNNNGTMFSGCRPVYKESDPSAYSFQQNESIPNGLFNWNYITCSVNTNKDIFYGLRGTEMKIETPKSIFPDYKSLGSSKLIFRPGPKTPANYGMLFIKDIKLWSIYNIKRFETKCYRPTGVIFHEQLLHYFENESYTNSIKDNISYKTAGGTKRKDFFGYNVLNLKTREEMIQKPFGICSVINVYPTTGIINVTKFTVQSKENQQLQATRYRFYYYLKNISVSPVSIGTQYGNPDVNVIFEYKDMPKETKSVDIELYVEVIPQVEKSYTLFKQLTLYREEEGKVTQLDYNTILSTLTLTTNMNDDMILDAQKSINRLETDLPKGLNSTYSKPKAVRGKNSIKLAKASCTDSTLCNGRGYCYNVEIMSYCTCFSGYTGRYCQISNTNFATLKKYQSELTSVVSYNLANNTNFANKNAVSSKEIQAIKLGFNTDLQNFNKLSDMKSYIDTMDILVKNSDQGNLGSVLTENRNEMMDIQGKMLGYLQTSQYKTMYDNLKNDIIASGNYTDPEGKYTVRFLPNPNQAFTSQISVNNTSVNSNTGQAKRLIKKTSKDFKRKLQSNTISNVNNLINDFVITVKDPSILSLTAEQNLEYKESYNKVYSQIESLTKTFINGSQGNPVKINQVNTMYNYTLDYFYMVDLEKLDFNNYFAQRIANGDSYFDARQCLLDNKDKIKAKNYDYFYMAYYFDDTPFFDFSKDLLNRAISLNSYLAIYDANANEIKLDCSKNKIKHYIGIYPQNQDFIDKFSLYPEKYQTDNPIYQSKEYMPYFILPNGTIDHINDLETQKKMYYRQYIVNITSYKNPNNPKDLSNFDKIIGYKYIYAEVERTGNLAAFTYFDGLTKMMGNSYYFKYNQIFQCSENYQNGCFILLILFFIFSIPILLLFICLKNSFRKFNSINEWSRREEDLIEKDNNIFGMNRYSFWDIGSSPENPLNSSKIFNNNMVLDSHKNVDDQYKKEGEESNNNNDENKFVMKENVIDEEGSKMQKVNISDVKSSKNNNNSDGQGKGICYSFCYFIFFRNIYSSFILLTSPFSPKYKTFSKFMFLIYCEMLFTCIFFIFGPFDLYGKLSSELDKGEMFLYILYSTLISNAFLVLLSLLNKPSNKMVLQAKESNFDLDSLQSIKNSNICKTLSWNILNIIMVGATFFVSFGYCSVWKQHSNTVIVLWILTFIFDFILMEIILEMFIMLFFFCRKVKFLRMILKFYIAIKSLRNYH